MHHITALYSFKSSKFTKNLYNPLYQRIKLEKHFQMEIKKLGRKDIYIRTYTGLKVTIGYFPVILNIMSIRYFLAGKLKKNKLYQRVELE